MHLSVPSVCLLLTLTFGLAACDGDSGPVFHASGEPLRLSEWNLFRLSADALEPVEQSLRVQPLNTLFTDYAHKLRTLSLPAGQRIELVDGRFQYPVGTILSKTFYYPRHENGDLLSQADNGELASITLNSYRLLETRLLVRRAEGWEAFPYVWNQDQSEAFLRVAGATLPIRLEDGAGTREFSYFIPNQNQCGGCHTRVHPDGGMEPLGAVAHQLNHPLAGSASTQSQLDLMVDRGWLVLDQEPAAIVSWQDQAVPVSERAAAYLDMNCGHCHNPSGPADTSGLLLDGFDRTPRQMGLCKPPVAAGGGAGNAQFGIVPGNPDDSILVYRMESVAPDEMMPELGRSLVHAEGIALVREWIESLSGSCD